MRGLDSKNMQVVATPVELRSGSYGSSPAYRMGTGNGWSLAVDTHRLSLQYVKTSSVDATESYNENVVETLSVSAPGAQPGPQKRQFLQEVLSAQLTSSSCHGSHFGSRYKSESDVRRQPSVTKRPW